MKRSHEWLAVGLCTAAVIVFTAFFEAHFANEEGKYLFVYTADLMGRFWPFGEWHYPGVPTLNGIGALFLHMFLTQFYHVAAGIYIVLAVAFALWLWGWWVYARRAGISALWRSPIVYPLATALFLFAAVSPKFPAGFLWGLIVALWLCVWSSRGCGCGGRGLHRKRRPLRKRTWRAYLSGAFLMVSMGFFPFLFFVLGYSILYWVSGERTAGTERTVGGNTAAEADLVTTHTEISFLGRKWQWHRQTQADKAYRPLWFALLALYWLCLPFAWAAVRGSSISRQSLAATCDMHVITQWKNNGISKDWKLYNCYQKTWRAIRQNHYQEALKQADGYWFSKRAINPDGTNFSTGEQYFRRQLAECTKLALLMSGELNSRFLQYNVFPEMAHLFEPFTPMVDFYNPVNQQFYWETGHLPAVTFEGVNIIERDGLRADVLPLLALSQVCLKQYSLAEKYLYLLQHTLFYRKEANKIALLNRALHTESNKSATWTQTDPSLSALIKRKRAETSPVGINSQSKDPQDEMTQLLLVHPHNLYVAEYALMCYLLSKDLASAYEVLKLYYSLGYTKLELPLYAQEAMLLFVEYGYRPEGTYAVQHNLIGGLEHFHFNPDVVERFEHFLQDKYAFEAGRINPNTFLEQYRHSYAFFFTYLAGFVDTPNNNNTGLSMPH